MSKDTPIAVCLLLLAAVLITFAIDRAIKRHPSPTPDQLYGCTVAQQAPSGECK